MPARKGKKKNITIYKDKKGKKYVKIGRKKVFLGNNITAKALKTLFNIGAVQNMIVNLNARRRRRSAESAPSGLSQSDKMKLKMLELERAKYAAQLEIGREQMAKSDAQALEIKKPKKEMNDEESEAKEQVPISVDQDEERDVPVTMPELEPIKEEGKEAKEVSQEMIDDSNQQEILTAVRVAWGLRFKKGNKTEVMKILNSGVMEDKMVELINEFARNKKPYPLPEINPSLYFGHGKSDVEEDGLDNHQIDRIMKKFPAYLGTIASDEVKTLVSRAKKGHKAAFISNTDTSKQEGSHWVAVLIDPVDSKSVEYYDSFAEDIPKIIEAGLKPLIEKVKDKGVPYLKFKTNGVIHQNNSSANCGFFAMNFLIDRLGRGKSFAEATGYDRVVADKSKENEKKIEKLKKTGPFKYV